MIKGFLIIKEYMNRFEEIVEPVCIVKTGKELDDKILEIGECDLSVKHIDYWETRNINLDTLEIF